MEKSTRVSELITLTMLLRHGDMVAIQYTRLSLVTGEKPVGLYRLTASRPPSAVHSARSSLLRSHRPAALWERRKPSLTSLHLWFAALNLAQAYAQISSLVKYPDALFPLSTNAVRRMADSLAI